MIVPRWPIDIQAVNGVINSVENTVKKDKMKITFHQRAKPSLIRGTGIAPVPGIAGVVMHRLIRSHAINDKAASYSIVAQSMSHHDVSGCLDSDCLGQSYPAKGENHTQR